MADPILTGTHVEIRPFEEGHITEAYLGWLNDRHLMRYSRQRFVDHTRESALAYLGSFQDSPSRFWSIHRRPDGLPVGTMTTHVDPVHQVADIGLLVGAPEARGRGLGREAWGMAMGHLFREAGVRKVTGGTVALNLAMVAIFRFWQMRLEGTLREQEVVDGRPADVLLFGTLRPEWERIVGTGPHR